MIESEPYQFTLMEWQEGLWLTIAESWRKKRLKYYYFSVGVASVGVVTLLALPQAVLGLYLIVVGTLIAFMTLNAKLVVMTLAAKSFKHKRNLLARATQSVTLSDLRFVGHSNPGGPTELPWSSILSWIRGNRVIVLVVGDRQGVVVPLRAFSHQNDNSQLLSLLTEKLGEPRSLNDN